MSFIGKKRKIASACLLGSTLSIVSAASAHATISLLDKDDWKVSMGGFVETDGIMDSTRSFREVIGNAPVSTSGATGGDGRTQFSIRNSRLAFTLDAPVVDGWTSKGYLEFDLLGFDPQNTSAAKSSVGASGANQSESSYFTNPTLRVRHAFMQAENDGLTVLAGQYWNLLGWQPYYFMSSADVAPLPGMLYSRNPQLRAMKAVKFSDQDVLQVAAALVRPPQADSRYPSLEAGVRYAMGERSSGFTGSSSGSRQAQPMSIALSGTAREFAIPVAGTTTASTEHLTGYGLAADAMIPVLASPDGKEVENTLSLLGEYTIGSGDGELLNGWTGGSANPLNASANAPSSALNMDAGIGDYDPNGSFHLMHVQTFNVHAQYHLPSAFLATWVDAGYGQLFSNNMASIANSSGQIPGSGSLAYNREQVIFGNIFHDFTPHVRAAVEYARVQTDYLQGYSAINNRYQVSAWFLF
ncbi:MAG: hypothetical protein P4M08_07305 [Oligoflexia bacterium]|nr:hypothetical protein [Oligoflexia bacterium]